MRRKYNLRPQSVEHEESFCQYTRFIKHGTTTFISLGLACSILSFIGTYYIFKPDHSNNPPSLNTPFDPIPHVVIDRFDRYPESQHINKPDLMTPTQDPSISTIGTKHIVSLPKKVRENPSHLFTLLPDYQNLLISVYYPTFPMNLDPLQQSNVNQIYATGVYLSPTGDLEITDQGKKTLNIATTNPSNIFISLESNISPEQFHQWISSPSKRVHTINQLVKVAKDHKLRGIHINLHQLQSRDQKPFTTFIEHLSRELHDNQKKLTISLHAFINNHNKIENSPAENWYELGKYADQVILKPVYISHQASYSTNFFDEVLKFTKERISPSKIHVHIPTNAYIKGTDHWEKLPPKEAQTLLETKSNTSRQANGDLVATVNVKGTKQPVIYQDEIGISHKLQTIKTNHPDIAGVISEVDENEKQNLKTLHLIKQEFNKIPETTNSKKEKK